MPVTTLPDPNLAGGAQKGGKGKNPPATITHAGGEPLLGVRKEYRGAGPRYYIHMSRGCIAPWKPLRK